MPLLKISVDCEGNWDPSGLAPALRALPRGAPVVVMIHGFRFSPQTPSADPHRHILSLHPRTECWKALSWPQALGYGRGAPREGLCIAFGWEARGAISRVWKRSTGAARALAELVHQVRGAGGPPVQIIGHSLGARVALRLLPQVAAGDVDRLVLLAAAAFCSEARAALASPAGARCEVFNVTSRENDLFDAMLERAVPRPLPGDLTVGAGLSEPHENWIDLQIDHPGTQLALTAIGHDIPAPTGKICHWSTYLRPGLMQLYADLLRAPETFPLARLRAQLPRTQEPRWTRLRLRPWGFVQGVPRLSPWRGLLGG